MMIDLIASLRFSQYWTFSTWMKFGLKYRKTTLGPIWLVVSPALFVIFLGYLFSKVNGSNLDVFVPHLAVGYITWTLLTGFVNGGATVFLRRRSEILQGQMRLTDLVLSEIFANFLQYLHQIIVILAVFIYFRIMPQPSALIALVGVGFILLNGFWLTLFLGIVGARYRDLVEIITAIMRLAFFITPIIWIPKDGAGGVLGAFLVLNPFYHILELVRAPLLGTPIALTTWLVVGGITLIGFLMTSILYKQSARLVPLWV